MDENLTYKIILIITLFLVLFVIYEIIEERVMAEKEGFDVGKIAKDMGNQIISPIKKGLENSIGTIGKGVVTTISKVDEGVGKISLLGKAVVNIAAQIAAFFKKVGMMFENLAKMLFTSIIQPLLGFFVAIGNVFAQLIQILLKIIAKIIDLPKCIPVYMFAGIKSGANGIYKLIVPGYIRDVFSFIWLYTVTYPLWVMYNAILKPLDYIVMLIFKFSIENTFNNFFSNKCNNFNVDSQLNSMAGGFTSAATNFTNKFGKIDFSKLW
jgi:hypothetical protein